MLSTAHTSKHLTSTSTLFNGQSCLLTIALYCPDIVNQGSLTAVWRLNLLFSERGGLGCFGFSLIYHHLPSSIVKTKQCTPPWLYHSYCRPAMLAMFSSPKNPYVVPFRTIATYVAADMKRKKIQEQLVFPSFSSLLLAYSQTSTRIVQTLML